MKSIIHIIMIILTLCSYGCKSDKDEFKITDVQFKNNIFKPLYMNYDYGTPICNKQDLEKYRLKRLGQKIRVTYYDKSIRLEILDASNNKEFILDYKGNGKYSGDGIDAIIDEKTFNNSITKLLQKSEMRKNMVMDLIYRGFIYAANYSESHYNPRRSQIKTELRYLFVTTPNR